MRAWRWFLPVWFLYCPGLLEAAGNKTEVTFVLSAEVARPGETILAGVRLQSAPHWHTYWRNPGEAGKSTEIEWQLPPGFSAGPIQWPVPEKYDWSGLFNYVYHEPATLLIPITVGENVVAGPYQIKARIDWLECEEQCVPGKADVAATLTIGETSRASAQAALLEQAKEHIPRPYAVGVPQGRWEKAPDGDKRPLLVSWKPTSTGTTFDFYPYETDAVIFNPATEQVAGGTGLVTVRKMVEKLEAAWPTNLAGLLVEQGKDGKVLAAHEAVFAILPETAAAEAQTQTPRDSQPSAGSGQPTSSAEPSVATDIKPVSLWSMLGLAFLGGLILNIMPCVLPVIALKILSFVNQSKESPGQVRRLGVIYALGVMVSFLVLAGLVIGVQKAGRVASWGMQFGNPVFLVAITVLVLLVALNLFGIFEVTLSGHALGAAGTLASKEGASGAFFNGVLATILATPCTAPFLSVALGFAFTQPPGIIVLVFLTVGLGLAAPYVVLSWQPAWLKFLPRPGAWMEKFKVAMGFPMLATGIWLFSILGRHYGQDGVLWVGLFLVMLALAAWVWGEFGQRGRRGPGLAKGVSAAIVIASYFLLLEKQLNWRDPLPIRATGRTLASEGGVDWQPWSPEAVQKARAEGRPVFVDFTADWCLTCKVNERSSIKIPSVESKLKEIGAVALLADNTLLPENIGRELQKYGRAGVPLVLVYPRDPAAPPMVLPTVLTPSIVLEALEKAK